MSEGCRATNCFGQFAFTLAHVYARAVARGEGEEVQESTEQIINLCHNKQQGDNSDSQNSDLGILSCQICYCP